MGTGGWFLERLQQVVRRLLGEPVGAGDDSDSPAAGVGRQREELLERGAGLLVAGLAFRRGPHPIDTDVLRGQVLEPEVGVRLEPARPSGGIEELSRQRRGGGGLAHALRADQEQRMGELLIDRHRCQTLEDGTVADYRVQRGHGMDCAELPTVTSVPDASGGNAAAASGRERAPLRRASGPLHGSRLPRPHRVRFLQRHTGDRSPDGGRRWRALRRGRGHPRRWRDPDAARRAGGPRPH